VKASQHALARYAISFAGVALAVALKWALDWWLGNPAPVHLFFLPLLLVAWFAGLGPSIASAALIGVSAQYVPQSPGFSLVASHLAPQRLCFFFVQALILCWLAAARKSAFKRIHETEQLYRTLAENIPQLVWVSSPDGDTVYQNRRLSEYTGPRLEKALGSEWQQVVHPDDWNAVIAGWRESLHAGYPLEINFRLRGRDGCYHWFLSRSTPVRNDQGEIIHWFSTATDIDQEKRAQESTARLAAIVETSEIAIMSKALDGTITSWNQGAQRIYGYQAEEVIGRHVSILAPPHLQNEPRELMDKIDRRERVDHFETARVRKDGRQIFVSLTVSPIYDPQGHITGFSSIGRDITARKLAEQRLKLSEAEFRAMFELAAVGQAQADLQTGRFTRVNHQFCEITGYSEAELLGMTFRDITHPDDLVADLARYRSVVDGKSPHWFSEKRYVRKDGSSIHVEVSGTLVREVDGQPGRTTAVIQDVTLRKRMQEALRESEERFRIAANTAPVIIWIRDVRGHSTFCNKTYTEFIGCTLEKVLAENWIDFVHPTDEQFCRDTFCSALGSRQAYEMEYRLRRADGQFRWVVESAVPRFAPDGSFEGFIGSCVDITERKWAEQALRGAFVELELQVADSRCELEAVERALDSEKTRREQAEDVLKKLGQP
jgi:PAS domain S-box-containing protein